MMNKKIFQQALFWGIIGGILYLFPADTYAAGDIFNEAYKKLWDTFKGVRGVIYVLSGFGLIGIAVGAIMGQINWKWLGSLGLALLALGLADQYIDYATDPKTPVSPITIRDDDGTTVTFDLSDSMPDVLN